MKKGKTTDAFNKTNQKPVIHKNYTHWQLLKKINLYKSLAKTKEQKKVVEKIKGEYETKEQKKPGNRFARKIHFEQGKSAMIHPQETKKNLENQYIKQDQRERNKLALKAKNFYHKNYSVSKAFNAKPKPKTKSMDKGK